MPPPSGAPVTQGSPAAGTGSGGTGNQPTGKGKGKGGGSVTPPIQGPVVAKTPWTAYIRPTALALVVLYVVIFVFLNRNEVEINFLFFTTFIPMIFLLIGMFVIGALVASGVMIGARRRAGRKAELAAVRAQNAGK